MQIGITISNENYNNAVNLRMKRELSGLINNFLTSYFENNEEQTDLAIEKQQLEEEQAEDRKKVAYRSMRLSIIESKMEEQRKVDDIKEKERLEKQRMKQRAIRNSGIFDDIGM